MTEIHTCSYSCERPECIRAQRDELAARVAAETSNAGGRTKGAALPKQAGGSLPCLLRDLSKRAAMQLGDGYRIEIERRADQLSVLLDMAERVVSAKLAHYSIPFSDDDAQAAALEAWADRVDELESAMDGLFCVTKETNS